MKKVLVVALLLSGLTHNAAASVRPDDAASNTKATKLNAYLKKVGLNSPQVLAIIGTVSGRMEDGHLRIAEEKFKKSRVVLHYKMEPRISAKQLQLKYQPYDSNVEYVATPKSLMVHYGWEF